jgi:hypothetical protein
MFKQVVLTSTGFHVSEELPASFFLKMGAEGQMIASMFLRHFGIPLPNYTMSHPRRL